MTPEAKKLTRILDTIQFTEQDDPIGEYLY